jgi:ATP-dependent HslUV protease ATP-binding subunit HslU
VELETLTEDDFVRILHEPKNALTMQYSALLGTEGVELKFADDAVREIARYAAMVNDKTENIGARRLHTILERLLDELSFDASDMPGQAVTIDAAYVQRVLAETVKDEDLSRYVL